VGRRFYLWRPRDALSRASGSGALGELVVTYTAPVLNPKIYYKFDADVPDPWVVVAWYDGSNVRHEVYATSSTALRESFVQVTGEVYRASVGFTGNTQAKSVLIYYLYLAEGTTATATPTTAPTATLTPSATSTAVPYFGGCVEATLTAVPSVTATYFGGASPTAPTATATVTGTPPTATATVTATATATVTPWASGWVDSTVERFDYSLGLWAVSAGAVWSSDGGGTAFLAGGSGDLRPALVRSVAIPADGAFLSGDVWISDTVDSDLTLWAESWDLDSAPDSWSFTGAGVDFNPWRDGGEWKAFILPVVGATDIVRLRMGWPDLDFGAVYFDNLRLSGHSVPAPVVCINGTPVAGAAYTPESFGPADGNDFGFGDLFEFSMPSHEELIFCLGWDDVLIENPFGDDLIFNEVHICFLPYIIESIVLPGVGDVNYYVQIALTVGVAFSLFTYVRSARK